MEHDPLVIRQNNELILISSSQGGIIIGRLAWSEAHGGGHCTHNTGTSNSDMATIGVMRVLMTTVSRKIS